MSAKLSFCFFGVFLLLGLGTGCRKEKQQHTASRPLQQRPTHRIKKGQIEKRRVKSVVQKGLAPTSKPPFRCPSSRAYPIARRGGGRAWRYQQTGKMPPVPPRLEATLCEGKPPYSRRLLRRIMWQRRRSLLDCYQKVRQKTPRRKGRLWVVLRVNGTGQLAKVIVKKTTLPRPTTTQCMVGVLQRLRFPPSGKGVAHIRYRLSFAPP